MWFPATLGLEVRQEAIVDRSRPWSHSTAIMSESTREVIAKAAAELKAAGARDIFLFGSARNATAMPRDLDLAMCGLPQANFCRAVSRVSVATDRLVDLDADTPFARCLQEEEKLVRVGYLSESAGLTSRRGWMRLSG